MIQITVQGRYRSYVHTSLCKKFIIFDFQMFLAINVRELSILFQGEGKNDFQSRNLLCILSPDKCLEMLSIY